MRSLLKPLLAFALSAILHVQAQSNEFKIGFIDTNRIFQEVTLAKTAQARLQQEFSKREKQLIDLGNALKTSSDQFERDQPTLSEAQKLSRQKQLVEMDRDLQRKRREFQEDLNARKNEEQQILQDRAQRAVKQVAESEKYDVVLQDVVYVNPKHDITDKVIKALNAAK